MYAIVSTGGKQYRVEEGQTLQVERLGDPGAKVDLKPVLVVDGSTVLATPGQLADCSVSAEVVSEGKGSKVEGFTYKSKTNQRRRYGHRQIHSTIEVTGIKKG